jgi:hypothetical protein
LRFDPLGTFDDSGVTATAVISHGSKKLLYYVGWNQGVTVRMQLFAGLAISMDGGETFARYSNAPILERTKVDPYLTATLSVLQESGLFRMWYVSGDRWEMRADGSYPFYNIKYAESDRICIDYQTAEEHASARPCVLKEDGIYKMWFACKGVDYRIGYAESKDGLTWDRQDQVLNLNVTPGGFDAKMMCYPSVVSFRGAKYMFYNGDDYGKFGIGLAVSR